MSKGRKIATCLELAEGCARDARLLIGAASRNAAYLASQAAEHLVTAIATSEDIHIERKDAHQLDTIIRRIPPEHPDQAALTSIGFLEAYSTSYRYGTPTGRVPTSPPMDRVTAALERIDTLLAALRQHFDIEEGGGTARNVAPRR
jgi:HEPN domain-containing protein